MRNVELKARCPDLEAVARRAERLGAQLTATLTQRDTFFAAGRGRLKLREVAGTPAELISYQRADAPVARPSEYRVYTTGSPAALATVLAQALGAAGVVAKRRRLYLLQQTRIHLDEVQGAGTFVELETAVDQRGDAAAHAELGRIADALGIRPEDVVPVAYVDLPARR
jgi:predicted adenylyl cyclase CyaB